MLGEHALEEAVWAVYELLKVVKTRKRSGEVTEEGSAMSDDTPKVPPLADLIGKRVQHQGHQWIVGLDVKTGNRPLHRMLDPEGITGMYQVTRDGSIVLDSDPAEMAARPWPRPEVAW
jgi:hypothetical protein